MGRDRSFQAVLEAALGHHEVDDVTWLAGVAGALEAEAGVGYGCAAALYSPFEESIGFEAATEPGMPSGLDARVIFEATTRTTPEFTREVYADITCATVSGIGPACERHFQDRVHDWGIRDAICINASLGEHRGAAFLIAQPRRRRLGMSEHRWFADVATLLRLALQTRRSAPPPGAPPSEHRRRFTARHVAQLPHESARLRAAGFQSIREIDEDGRRRIVVEPTSVGALAVLSSRERAVVLALRSDTSNKEIADALGIASSTVGVLLHRAAAKLGVRSRSELVEIASQAGDVA